MDRPANKNENPYIPNIVNINISIINGLSNGIRLKCPLTKSGEKIKINNNVPDDSIMPPIASKINVAMLDQAALNLNLSWSEKFVQEFPAASPLVI